MFPQEPSGDAEIWFDNTGQPAFIRAGDYWFKAHHHCGTNHAQYPIRLTFKKDKGPLE